MREQILERLRNIEERERVTILHAVESGSRAWGFASPDSDYDVRFLYVRPAAWYLQLEKTRDVLGEPVDEVWDVNGWDLQKALRLMHGSNPTLLEWLHSPVVYRTTPLAEELRVLGASCYRKRAGLNHYISMAKNNWETHLRGETVQAKKYLYVLRPVLACRWILSHGSPPPVLFDTLAESQLAPELRPVVAHLLEKKRVLPEGGKIEHITLLDQYLKEGMEEIAEQIRELPREAEPDWKPLDRLFQKVLAGGESVWC